MITIRIKETGKIQEVTRNIAYDLIDKGLAEVVVKESPKKVPFGYTDRQFRSRRRR